MAEGSAAITITARDPGGLAASQNVAVTVQRPNSVPQAMGTIPAQTLRAGESAVVNLSSYFTDPDGDALTYDAASSNTSVVTAAVSGGTLTFSGVAEGSATVTVTARDPGGLAASQNVAVTVQRSNRAPQAVGTVCALVTDDHLAAIDGRLDLTNDGITSLKPDDFAGLSSLEALTVSDNSLVVLPDALFAGLPSLETLRLSNNRLTSLPRAAFFELAELRELNLTNNLLTSLEEGMFAGLSRLESLHLNGNRLTGLPDRVFSGMPLLRALQLSRNQLRSLTREAFAGLPLLRQLWLYENELGVGTLPDGVFSQLTSLWVLDLNDNRMPDLSSAAFSGLTSLGSLELADNLLTSLPDGLFAGMSRLFSVHLHDNPTDPLPITISLEPAGEGQFKARAHAGAPFDITLPIGVTNGVMDGGSTVTIPIGSVESRVVTVTRAAGTTGPVTVDLGELPGLPRERSSSGRLYHQGYELSRSADLPLQVLSAAAGWRYRRPGDVTPRE